MLVARHGIGAVVADLRVEPCMQRGNELGVLAAIGQLGPTPNVLVRDRDVARRCSSTSRVCTASDTFLTATRWVPPSAVLVKMWVVALRSNGITSVRASVRDFGQALGIGRVRCERQRCDDGLCQAHCVALHDSGFLRLIRCRRAPLTGRHAEAMAKRPRKVRGILEADRMGDLGMARLARLLQPLGSQREPALP